MPPPELGCIHGNLQARLAREQVALAFAQQILSRLSPGGGPSKLSHQRVDLSDGGSARQQWDALSESGCSASRVADRARDNPAQP